ncbi:hypothetical protein MBLNU459_g6172t1 [Dothideomycetes sp. NU459]
MVAIRPLIRPGLGPLLALPPALRHSVYQQQHARSFSISAITGSIPAGTHVESALALVPATVMESLSSIGLPWYAVLPLSAVVFRSLLVYPLFQRPLRKRLAQRASITPLVQANISLQKRWQIKDHRNMLGSSRRLVMVLWRWRATRAIEQSLFNRWTIPYERLLSFVTLVTVSESLRRLCGIREGLLSVLMRPFNWLLGSAPDAAPAQHPAQSDNTAVETLSTSSPTDAIPPAEFDALSASAPPSMPLSEQGLQSVASSPPLAAESPWFEPALLDGGFSWCPDLTAADPTLTLPFLFSASFFANIYFSPRIAGQQGTAKPTNLQRIFMTIAVFSIVPALQMPCALLIYYISNIWISALQSRWLAYKFPIRPTPSACRRPIRMQPLKELSDEPTGTSIRIRR